MKVENGLEFRVATILVCGKILQLPLKEVLCVTFSFLFSFMIHLRKTPFNYFSDNQFPQRYFLHYRNNYIANSFVYQKYIKKKISSI